MNPSIELLRRCCRDDRRAHLELYTLSFGFILSVCRRYFVNREDAAAAINMVFLKMIRGMDHYLTRDKHVPFELWVRRITLNHVTDEFRKNKAYRERFSDDDVMEVAADMPASVVEFPMDRISQWENIIGQLSPMGRAVFNLHVIEGYRHEEIANQLGISVNTSKVHLHRAKKQLREWITTHHEYSF